MNQNLESFIFFFVYLLSFYSLFHQHFSPPTTFNKISGDWKIKSKQWDESLTLFQFWFLFPIVPLTWIYYFIHSDFSCFIWTTDKALSPEIQWFHSCKRKWPLSYKLEVLFSVIILMTSFTSLVHFILPEPPCQGCFSCIQCCLET